MTVGLHNTLNKKDDLFANYFACLREILNLHANICVKVYLQWKHQVFRKVFS